MAIDKKACDRLILGTAQWGFKYGVANTQGVTSGEEISKILERASIAGVSVLDTAPGYGESESKIGMNALEGFEIITKIPKLAEYSSNHEKVKAIQFSLEKSMFDLRVRSVHGLLFHHADDLIKDNQGLLLREVNQLKADGYIKNIGVSVYSGDQIDSILDILLPDIVQVPLNILDQRLVHSGHLKKLNALGVAVHVRSVFLQGLFHMPIEKLPKYFQPIKHLLLDINVRAAEQRLSINQAALTFVRDQPYVDKILVGIESLFQHNEALRDFLVDPSFKAINSGCDDEAFINPAKWDIKVEN